jgi:hypothetical protein
VIPAAFINSPANINKEIANSGKLDIETHIILGASIKDTFFETKIATKPVNPKVKAIGMPKHMVIKKVKIT